MIVRGEGNPSSKVWLIGEAPGAKEDEIGKPFSGSSGMYLNGFLRSAGLSRENCYIDNVIQERPPKNDFGVFYENASCTKPKPILLEAHEVLKQKIRTHRPNVVVALGNEALYAITGDKGILKWRGSILNFDGVKIIPTIHPAMVMREPKFSPIVQVDFNRIAEQSKTPAFPRVYNDNFIINPSFETCMEYLTKVLPSKKRLTFDIETIPPLEQIMCIGFGWSKEDAICIPIFFGQSSWWTEAEEIAIIKSIQNLLSRTDIEFIAQNAQYDMTYLKDKWDVRCTLYMDTMISFHCIYPEFRKSLAFITSLYSYRPYYKDDGGQGNTPEQEWTYNCKDVCVTFEVAEEIEKEMKEYGTFDFYREHSNKLIEPLMYMQSRGILIDVDKRNKLSNELSAKISELQDRLNKAVGKEINVNSPKQIKELLYDDLGLPPIYGWGKKDGQKARVLSTDEDAIEELQKRTNNPVLGIILEIRGLVKMLGTYVNAELESNNRICCSYKITGTETGRLSSTKSIYDRGTNLQNIPREASIRSMFISDPGYTLVNADLSQAEARIVAYIADEERMIQVFENHEDIHCINASIIFNVHPSKVSKEQRQAAKNRVHGANYGIGPARAAKLAGTSEAKAREDLNKYKSLYPMLEIWWRRVEEQMAKTRTMTNYFGRKRTFFGRWGQDMIREAIAYYPQSTVGDLLNYGIIRAWKNLPPQWELLANNHDAILMQVPDGTPNEHLSRWLKHYFEIPLEIHGRKFIIPMDIKTGKNWGEMKDIKL